MIASKVFIQIEESQERTSSMPSLWEMKIYIHVQIIIGLHCILHLV